MDYRKGSRMWWFPEMALGKAVFIGNIANVALLFSLVMGVISTYLIAGTTNIKEKKWEENRQTSDLKIAEANARAMEAKLELEKIKTPRILSDEDSNFIIEKIKPFSGQKFDAAMVSGDYEADKFLRQLEDVLKEAGWVQIDWVDITPNNLFFNRPERSIAGQTSAEGVLISMPNEKQKEFGPAITALSKALIEKGHKVEFGLDPSGIIHSKNTDVIHLAVGHKPN